jgi:hypothetical protein
VLWRIEYSKQRHEVNIHRLFLIHHRLSNIGRIEASLPVILEVLQDAELDDPSLSSKRQELLVSASLQPKDKDEELPVVIIKIILQGVPSIAGIFGLSALPIPFLGEATFREAIAMLEAELSRLVQVGSAKLGNSAPELGIENGIVLSPIGKTFVSQASFMRPRFTLESSGNYFQLEIVRRESMAQAPTTDESLAEEDGAGSLRG